MSAVGQLSSRKRTVAVVCTLVVVGSALAVALFGRMVGVDPSYLMLIAQEVYLGRAQYTQILDLQPPASVYIHSPAIVLYRLFGFPIMEGWNLYLVFLGAISAYLFGSRAEVNNRLAVMVIWFGCLTLGFDDHLFGQREFFFAVAWYPYLAARLSRPVSSVPLADIVLGLLLSVAVCAKPLFIFPIVFIDLPILFLCRGQQSIMPFAALVAGGIIQLAQFFLCEPVAQYFALSSKLDYYATVGFKLLPSLVAFFGTTEIYVLAAVVVVLLRISPRRSPIRRYVYSCWMTGVLSFAIGILQGHPRSYYFIPVVLSAVAASLHALFHRFGDSAEENVASQSNVNARLPQTILVVVSIFQVLFMENGAGRAWGIKYVWGNPASARIGRDVDDIYVDWVMQHVSKSEEISVIALQYGTTSAWDPILSTLRLGRRVNSYAPVLQFPLRAALVSGDKVRIDDAWKTLMGEITTAKADWVIIRQTAPEPLDPDFMNTVRKTPLFYDWLLAHYPIQEQFGPYFAFRRNKDKQ